MLHLHNKRIIPWLARKDMDPINASHCFQEFSFSFEHSSTHTNTHIYIPTYISSYIHILKPLSWQTHKRSHQRKNITFGRASFATLRKDLHGFIKNKRLYNSLFVCLRGKKKVKHIPKPSIFSLKATLSTMNIQTTSKSILYSNQNINLKL